MRVSHSFFPIEVRGIWDVQIRANASGKAGLWTADSHQSYAAFPNCVMHLARVPNRVRLMEEPLEVGVSRLVAGPVVCPICWGHALERIEGIRLVARTVTEHDISRVLLYRCDHWHMFAVFEQAL